MNKLGLLFVVITALVSSASCVNKEMPITETYYETETKTESYVDVVNGEYKLTPESNWYCENLVISVQPAESESNGLPTELPRSFSGVWYFGYKLPEHSSSKVIIQTWDKDAKSTPNLPSLYNSPTLPLSEQQEGEMVSAYDVSGTGHWTKPPFDKSLYTIYHYIGPGGYDFKSSNVYPYEEKQFNEWLDYFNARLSNPVLGTQYSKSEYQFDTTGINTLAIIIAGRKYRSQEDLNLNMGYAFIPQQASVDPTPVKSIKLIWSDEMTKQREVPHQVEKQRTVMQTKKIPFWKAVFH